MPVSEPQQKCLLSGSLSSDHTKTISAGSQLAQGCRKKKMCLVQSRQQSALMREEQSPKRSSEKHFGYQDFAFRWRMKMVAIRSATRGRCGQEALEAALLSLPANSGIRAVLQRQGHLIPREACQGLRTWVFTVCWHFPRGDQEQQNHQIDDLLFAG